MVVNFEGLIFDLDGTLTAPGHIDFAGLRAAIQCPDNADILGYIEEVAKVDSNKSEDLAKIVERFEAEALDLVKGGEGLHKTLIHLKELGLPMGILTRNSRRNMETTLKRLEIDAFFAAAIAREDAPPKPKPDGVLHLCKSLGIQARSTLVVGDYVHDIEAGNRAGAWTAWLKTTKRTIAPEGSNFKIDQLSDLLPLVEGDPIAWQACLINHKRG